MVASGSGVTILPSSSISDGEEVDALLDYRPFSRPVPQREVILVWRDSYPRRKLVQLIADTTGKYEFKSTASAAPGKRPNSP